MDIDQTVSPERPGRSLQNIADHNADMISTTPAVDATSSSSTANAILNILQQISISPPKSNEMHSPTSSINIPTTAGYKPSLQHLHSLPKSIIPKRRLSSSSSFDGFSTTSGNGNNTVHNGVNASAMLNSKDKSHKKQLVYLRGPNKIPIVRYIPSPLSRSFLIKRLNTFSVFNWTISSNKLSPLVCATQGWKCHPVRKNELHCTSCHSGMIVKLPEMKNDDLRFNVDNTNKLVFNNHHHDDHYYDELFLKNTDKYELQYEFRFLDDELDEDEDENDDVHVYETLVNSYVKRLSTDHYPTCTFLPILPLTPKDESYYISSKDIPREVMKFKERLALLMEQKDRLVGKNFRRICFTSDETQFLLEYLRQSAANFDMIDDGNVDKIHVDGETTDSVNDLYVNPSLDVILPALFGWELKIQKFHNEKFLLLKCESCTRRILLNTVHERVDNVEELQSCPHRAEIPAQEQRTEFDETVGCITRNGPSQAHTPVFGYDYGNGYDEYDDEDDDTTDLAGEHDAWCCMRQGWRIVLEGLRSSADGLPLHLRSPQSPAASAQSAIEALRRL